MELSVDQQKILKWDGHGLKVQAGPGSGKTFILKKLARKQRDKRILYLAYNRSIRDEAKQSFPSNTSVQTFHELAMNHVGYKFRHKLVSGITVADLRRMAPSAEIPLLRKTLEVLNSFVLSSYYDFPATDTDPAIQLAQQAWESMCDEHSGFPMTHDGYFKLFALTGPLLDFDMILVDEAQDLNGAKIQFISRYSSLSSYQVVLVGDKHQMINRWNGAKNAFMDPQFSGFDELTLQNSFRFGVAIARVANMILQRKGELEFKVESMLSSSKVVKTSSGCPNHKAIICRTVAGVIELAQNLAAQQERLYFVGGLDSYRVQELHDLFRLRQGKTGFSNKQFMEFASYGEYERHCRQIQDERSLRLLKLAERFPNITSLTRFIKQFTVENESEATVTLTTAHRSKGLEWNWVQLHTDFPDLTQPVKDISKYHDEANLGYVAATRAVQTLEYGINPC